MFNSSSNRERHRLSGINDLPERKSRHSGMTRRCFYSALNANLTKNAILLENENFSFASASMNWTGFKAFCYFAPK